MRISLSVTLGILALSFSACVPKIDTPEPQSGTADFSRLRVIGGSEFSGYQDGALYQEGQLHSVGALISAQMAYAGGSKTYNQPLMPTSVSMGLNKPWESRFLKASKLGDRTDCQGELSLGPVRDTISEAELDAASTWAILAQDMNDYSIPFAGLQDLLNTSLGADRSLDGPHAFAARHPFSIQNQSPLGAVLASQPSFYVMWPGLSDIYNWARQGGHGVSLPSPADFRNTLDSILGALDAAGAKGVLGNLPDIGHFPYFRTIPPRALELSQNKADSLNDIYNLVGASVNFQAGENGFIVGDPNAPNGFRQLLADEYITLSVPLDSMKCYYMGVLFTLMPDRYTLIQSELSLLRAYTLQYNVIIAELADQYGLALADFSSFYDDLQSGIRFDAVDFDTEFVSGGFFSLDGWHAHPKGASMVANHFIHAINAKFGATVPTVELHTLRGVLFP